MKLGDKVFVKDNWIEQEFMMYQGTIVEVAYFKDSVQPMVYLVQFEGFKSYWFHAIALKSI